MMEEVKAQDFQKRRKRVQTLKKLIVGIWVASMCIPVICCVILFVKVHELNHTLTELGKQLEDLSTSVAGLESAGEYEAMGEGYARVGESSGDGVYTMDSVENASMDMLADAVPDAEAREMEAREAAHKVYLTFDDGPSIYTQEILDILDRYDVKATFFVVGKEDEASKEALMQIVERGHSLGMHSYSHKYSELYQSVDAFAEDFQKLRNYLYEVTGVESNLYRFPGGSSNTVSRVDMQEFVDYLDQQGVTFYDWNIASGDGSTGSLSVQQLLKNSTKDIEKWHTAILLMHDAGDKRSSVEALPMIIENILAMDDTVILPITEETTPVQHIHTNINQ